ncbi:Ig-like domain-containing protein [Paenibacillus qinlingensis]|uniref:Ig-like domain-containing protein n=1 Tax=Paenibacillus qinlingensis TaxID=1837343 RepID=UPI00156748C4|nr:Ig-like domain-containing protein [Paenibacillus qinlingensis]NQX57517.1 Ig-like domain-containing protein [Paenibacillus qinlingensis]
MKKLLGLFLLIAMFTIPTVVSAASTTNELNFSIPMNTFCSGSNQVDLSLNITNLNPDASNLTLNLYKKGGSQFNSVGSAYDGIDSTITPGSAFNLNANDTAEYHFSFGGQSGLCTDRPFSGKLIANNGADISIVASGFVRSSSGVAPIIINAGKQWDVELPLVVVSTDPANSSISVPVNKIINIIFNKNIQLGDITKQIQIVQGSDVVASTFAINSNVLTIQPTQNLLNSQTYTVIIPAGTIVSGNTSLKSDYTFSFTTTAPPSYSTDLTDGLPTSAFSASSSYSASFTPDKAFNNLWNSNGTNNWSSQNSEVLNSWIKVEFSSAKSIAKLIYQADAYAGYSVGMKNFRVEASNDNTTWTTQYEGTALQNGTHQAFTWTPTGSYKYWRVLIVDAYNPQFVQISELEMMEQQ